MSLTLAFLEVRGGAVKLGGIGLLVKVNFDAKELLIGRELIPACVIVAGAKGIIISGGELGISAGDPGLELTLATESLLATDVSVGTEGWKRKVKRVFGKAMGDAYYRRWSVWNPRDPMCRYQYWSMQ